MTKVQRLGKIIIRLTRKLEEANAKLERFRGLFELEEMCREERERIRQEMSDEDET